MFISMRALVCKMKHLAHNFHVKVRFIACVYVFAVRAHRYSLKTQSCFFALASRHMPLMMDCFMFLPPFLFSNGVKLQWFTAIVWETVEAVDYIKLKIIVYAQYI